MFRALLGVGVTQILTRMSNSSAYTVATSEAGGDPVIHSQLRMHIRAFQGGATPL